MDTYVREDVTPLLATDHSGSEPVIGWTHTYGKARVVTLQSGHDTHAFENPDFRNSLNRLSSGFIRNRKI